jgi:hypothetical protein
LREDFLLAKAERVLGVSVTPAKAGVHVDSGAGLPLAGVRFFRRNDEKSHSATQVSSGVRCEGVRPQ